MVPTRDQLTSYLIDAPVIKLFRRYNYTRTVDIQREKKKQDVSKGHVPTFINNINDDVLLTMARRARGGMEA